MRQPIIVAYGVGRDSTALLIEMQRRGMRPDAILFANIGSEKRETYEFIPVMSEWLAAHDFPPITIVQYAPKSAPYRTLEGNMILNATLPGATFGKASCTMKFKINPQESWTRRWRPASRNMCGSSLSSSLPTEPRSRVPRPADSGTRTSVR